MLLLQIVKQLDGELVRLRSLRDVVAGLAKSSPAVRGSTPKLERVLTAAPLVVESRQKSVPEKLESTVKQVNTPAEPRPVAPVVRARRIVNRTRPEAAARPETPVRMHRGTRRTEPTALGKAASTGPVVISAAALVREREARLASKPALANAQRADAEPEIRPEAFARELAARWLLSPVKT